MVLEIAVLALHVRPNPTEFKVRPEPEPTPTVKNLRTAILQTPSQANWPLLSTEEFTTFLMANHKHNRSGVQINLPRRIEINIGGNRNQAPRENRQPTYNYGNYDYVPTTDNYGNPVQTYIQKGWARQYCDPNYNQDVRNTIIEHNDGQPVSISRKPVQQAQYDYYGHLVYRTINSCFVTPLNVQPPQYSR